MSHERTETESGGPVRVWALLRDQFAHVEPVERHLGARAEFVYDAEWRPGGPAGWRPDVLVCVNEFSHEGARCIDAARAAGIPSLLLQDGVLEWRCQYTNPLFGAGNGAPQHQPVLCDRIACLGDASARHLASWGNRGRVEVTGMPRLDALLERPKPPRPRRRRLLVMTAKKPWFDEAQRGLTLRSLRLLRDALAAAGDVEVVWRVTKGLADELGVRNELRELGTADLATVLEQVDAVVSTPSTAVLEAMLMERPTAALDFHNVPAFTPTAWRITAPEQISPVVRELLDPPATKLAFQAVCLRDALRSDGPAAPRVGDLLLAMARAAREARAQGRPLTLPPVLCAPGGAAAPAPPLGELYPHHPAFREADPAALQVRLARLEKENATLRDRLRAQGGAYWIAAAARYVGRRLTR